MRLPQFERYSLAYSNPSSQLKDAIIRQSDVFFAEGEAARDRLRSPEELRDRQAAVREFLITSLGQLPLTESPLNARVTGTVEGDGFTIEKVIYEARPRSYVTANLYLPKQRTEKTPAVLMLCGHAATAKAHPAYQTVCQLLAKAGLIVLIQDPVGQGERLSYYDPVRRQNRVRPCTGDHDYAGIPAVLLGDSIARYFLHDAMRSLDYLASRPEVDADRLGVTGNSGGGTQACLLMATDPRIKAAAPGTFVTSRKSYLLTGQAQDAEQIWPGFTAAGFDHEDILLAMAPKPLAVLAVKSDFFPIEGTRRSVERVRRFWKMHQSNALELHEDADVHGYTLPLARKAAQFFARHLLGKEIDTSNWASAPFADALLNATASGQVSTEFSDAEFVFHATAVRALEVAAARHSLPDAERRQRAVDWLRETVHGPRRGIAAEINPRLIARNEVCEGFDVDTAFWYPQPHVANLAFLFRRPGMDQAKLGITIAIWNDGTRHLHDHLDWIAQETAKQRAVLVLNLSGMGPLLPDPNIPGVDAHNFYGTLYKLSDELRWNGDSLAALRIWEVTRAIDALRGLAGAWAFLDIDDLHLYGHGKEGMYVRLAAAIDPRVKDYDWEGSFTWASIVANRYYNAHDIKPRLLPGALAYFDLDELP